MFLDSFLSYHSDPEMAEADPTNHPLMDRVQKALFEQLTKRDNLLSLELREKSAIVTDLYKKRQALGVELYGFQQQLAALQSNLEQSSENFISVQAGRKQAEQARALAASQLQLSASKQSQLDKQNAAVRRELEKLNGTLSSVEAYNEKVKAEIRVTRRDAYGTEDQMAKLEKAKVSQDFRADNLQEQLRGYEEQSRAYVSQIGSQKEDLRQAKSALKESEEEMAKIESEKSDLVQNWKSTLIAMANRDTALQTAQGALKQQSDKLIEMDMALEAYKKLVAAEHIKNEQQTTIATRIGGEIEFIDSQIASFSEQRKALSAKYSIVREGISNVERMISRENQEGKELRLALDVAQRAYEKLVAEKNEVDDQIMANLNDQTTIEKGFQKMWSDTQKLKMSIRATAIEIGETENLLAKVNVDALKTASHNSELAENLKGLVDNLKENDSKIGHFEKNIRRQNDQIEKRQLYMAQLNKSFEQLMANAITEDNGPLEATIHHLRTELLGVEKSTTELQREWIQKQNELVNLVADTNQQQQLLRSLQSKLAVLGQKRMRVDQELEQNKVEQKDLGRAINQMTTEMKRLNELISQNAKMADDIANQNFSTETDFVRKLKELEQGSAANHSDVVRLEQEREILFADVIEAEKQILLWEKKVELERETQNTLNPSYGQVEIEGMRKEIHRMRLRYQQLQKQQEKMIQDMEKTVSKRDPITSLHALVVKSSLKSGLTNTALKKKITSSKDELKKAVVESRNLDDMILKQSEQNRQLTSEIQNQNLAMVEFDAKRATSARRFDDLKFAKRVNSEAVRQQQSAARRYEEVAEDRYQMTITQDRIVSETTKAKSMAAQIEKVLNRLKVAAPKHQQWFDRLRKADQFE